MTNCSSRKKFFQILKGLLVKWCGKRDLNSHVLGHQLLRLGCLPFHHFRISKCREIYFIKSIDLKWYNIFYIPSFKTLTLRMKFTSLFIYFDRSLTASYISSGTQPNWKFQNRCQQQFNFLIRASDLWLRPQDSNLVPRVWTQ